MKLSDLQKEAVERFWKHKAPDYYDDQFFSDVSYFLENTIKSSILAALKETDMEDVKVGPWLGEHGISRARGFNEANVSRRERIKEFLDQ